MRIDMQKWMRLCAAAVVLVMVCGKSPAAERLVLNFNPDWKFSKADPNGAQQPGFDDRQWSSVSAPHTYNDIDTFDDWSIPGHRGEQNQWGGRTWYRKSFMLPDSFRGRKVYIEFEAVRQVAEVYLNGRLLGVSKTGFAPFGFDLTPHLKFDGVNVLAVMCDNRFMKDPLPGEAGRDTSLAQISARVNEAIPEDVNDLRADQIPWNNPHWHPAHGGIYRNVRLYVTDPLHISLPLYSFLRTAGPYVYATDVSRESARVTVEVPVENGRSSAQNVDLRAEVFDADGRSVLVLNQSIPVATDAKADFRVSGTVAAPLPWEPDFPHVYRVVCMLRVADEIVDNCEIPLGIRIARWDAKEGLFLNGRHLKLHGWGQKPTDEWPGLGAAQPDWMHYFTLDLMKEAGGSFVRWGHCLGGPAQIEAADRLGLVVEQPGVDGESDTRAAAWKLRAAAFRDTVIYFRNHPSILIWEGGNQKVSREHAKELRGYMDTYDPHGGRVYAHRRADETTAEFMDIGIGTEGGREIARLPVVEGEYDREESPRRVWDDASPPKFGYPEAKGQTYQLTSEQYAANQVGQYVRKLGAANHAGGGNWIFSDSTSGGRVACEVARVSGEVDGARLPKEAYYVCGVMFSADTRYPRPDPRVHIIGHWTYPASTKKTVYVASNAQEVELLVNGKSLGRGKVSDRYLFTWPDVSWEPGEIKAIAYTGGKEVATQVKRTAGAPVALRMTPITGPGGLRADGSDIVLIDVEAVDAGGNRCPTFEQRVDFEVQGPGAWRGGYNSGRVNSINNTYLDLECGINRVAVRATRTAGQIVVRAKCAGLAPASVAIESKPFPAEGGFTTALPVFRPAWRLSPQFGRLFIDVGPAAAPSAQIASPVMVGRFKRAFSYSGPAQIVHVEQDAQNGKNVYVDRDYAFVGLPVELIGADWVQAAEGDSTYNAVDLMEVAVKAGEVVFVAHDDRLARPVWLTRQFQANDSSLTVNGRSMTVFQHRADRDESLTLGANTENPGETTCNMYVVFVNAAPEPSRSEWVYPGPDGKLVYKTTPAGDRIMDFSYAGYVGGGVALPDVPVKITVQPVVGDNTAAIQDAIDKVSAMNPEGNFRGAVLLAPGDYPCSGTISIRTDGVALRGSGSGAGGSTIKMTGGRHVAIAVGRSRGRGRGPDAGRESNGVTTSISDAYVPSGAASFTVADASGFAVGDTIEIRRPVTPAWVHFMQMDNLVRDGRPQTWIRPGTEIIIQRRIAAIAGNKITLDVPLSDSFDARYLNPPGTSVVKVTPAALLTQVGVENLHIQAPPQHMSYTQAPYSAMRINGEDCWARDVLIEETMNSVSVGGRRITLQRVAIHRTVPNVGASKPAEFAPNAGQILLDRCSGNGDNIWHVATAGRLAGPIVLLNCTFGGTGHIEGHQRWATGMLVDNCRVPEGGIDFKNRGSMGSGHGWAMGWAVAWNCTAKTYVVQQPPGAFNWMIGCKGENIPTPRPFDQSPTLALGISDSPGRPVAPQSLYLAQLAERLGLQAVENIGYSIADLTAQKELSSIGNSPPPLEPVPSTRQLEWQENELTLFVHFGMNTFTGRSTGLGDEDPNLFNPTDLDCMQWATVAKETGFKGIILTAKHHDGFCIWPTKTTRHSLVSSRWRNGQGDVVRELADACKQTGIKLGIYCSPWDRSQTNYTQDKAAYSKYYRDQLIELMSNYGPIFEMWFDGNRADVASWPEVIKVVRSLEPQAVIKQGPFVAPVRDDVRWVGNPEAKAPLTNWSVYLPPDQQSENVRIWLPLECDIPMVGNWFWNDRPPLSLDDLLNIYYWSVGRNSMLLLNVAPNKQGKFSEESVARLREFRAALDKIFGTDFALGKSVKASNTRSGDPSFGPDRVVDGDKETYWATDDGVTSAWLEVDLGSPREFNVVRTEEFIELGQRIAKYKVEAQTDGQWRQIADGATVGYRKLDRFPKVTASKVRLTIEEARGSPTIKSFGVHLDSVSDPKNFEPAVALSESSRRINRFPATALGAQHEFEPAGVDTR
jgi:beta-galactosidase